MPAKYVLRRSLPALPAELLLHGETLRVRQASSGPSEGSSCAAPTGVCVPFLRVFQDGPCPCLLWNHIIPLVRVRIRCAVFPFPSKSHRDLGRKHFLERVWNWPSKEGTTNKKLAVNPSEGGEADPLLLCYLLNEGGQGEQELPSPKRILGSGNRTLGSSLLPILR